MNVRKYWRLVRSVATGKVQECPRCGAMHIPPEDADVPDFLKNLCGTHRVEPMEEYRRFQEVKAWAVRNWERLEVQMKKEKEEEAANSIADQQSAYVDALASKLAASASALKQSIFSAAGMGGGQLNSQNSIQPLGAYPPQQSVATGTLYGVDP